MPYTDYATGNFGGRNGDELTKMGIPPLANEFHIDNLKALVELLVSRERLSRKGAALVMDNLTQGFKFNPAITQYAREPPFTSLYEVADVVAAANILFPPEEDPFAKVRESYERRYADV